jgi:pimeloyl-ACP methyl ester carboxylesterase
MELTVQGHRLYVEVHGSAADPAVVLLHHGLGSTRAWKEQIPAFEPAGLRVVAYDRWGYGASAERIGLGIPDFAQDVADLGELLNQLEIERAHLVGHSDGGTIALAFAARETRRVNRLVTVAAHIYIEAKMAPGIQRVAAAFEGDPRFRRSLDRVHSGRGEQVFQNWYTGWYREATQDWDMRPLLKQVQAPALVIQGLKDEHAAPQHAVDLAEALPCAELWLVEEAAHMLPQENAGVFNPRVLQFLSSPQT